MAACPFCAVTPIRILLESRFAIAALDGFPVSDGHTLVVPRRHVASVYDLTAPQRQTLWDLAAEVRLKLRSQFSLDGFNIGFNDGTAAGQTISHAHIHVIHRHYGDVQDPRGGIRWIIGEPHETQAGELSSAVQKGTSAKLIVGLNTTTTPKPYPLIAKYRSWKFGTLPVRSFMPKSTSLVTRHWCDRPFGRTANCYASRRLTTRACHGAGR